jgi:hypothetical protein
MEHNGLMAIATALATTPTAPAATSTPTTALRWSDTELATGTATQQGDDAFINDASQWNDTDGDGYGDNRQRQQPGRVRQRLQSEWEGHGR